MWSAVGGLWRLGEEEQCDTCVRTLSVILRFDTHCLAIFALAFPPSADLAQAAHKCVRSFSDASLVNTLPSDIRLPIDTRSVVRTVSDT